MERFVITAPPHTSCRHLSPQGGENDSAAALVSGAVGIPSPLWGGKAAAMGGGNHTLCLTKEMLYHG
jgi:hypothetical protein